MLRYFFDCLLKVIYPSEENCLICNRSIDEESWLCKSCINKIKFCQDDFSISKNNLGFKYYSLAYYSDVITELILRLKYKSDFDCSYALGDMMSSLLKKESLTFDFITFVPASSEVIKKRGYNQSELLAKQIGKNMRIHVKNYLYKIIETKDQIGLNDEMRWKNCSNSFRFNRKYSVKEKKILLVDDVITTGATAYSCAKEIKNAGAEAVIILTAAKSKL